MTRTRNILAALSATLVCAPEAFAQASVVPTLDAPATVMFGSCSRSALSVPGLKTATRIDLAVFVDEKGQPKSAQPVGEMADQSLLSAATAFAQTCRFRPALVAGQPSPGIARMEVGFPPSLEALQPQPAPAGSRPAIANVKSCAPTADDYPIESRRLNETGTTRISFTIDQGGKLTAFAVIKSSGSLRLDFTALIKLAGCNFRPGVGSDGGPIGGTFAVEYVWKLE